MLMCQCSALDCDGCRMYLGSSNFIKWNVEEEGGLWNLSNVKSIFLLLFLLNRTVELFNQ